MVGFVASGLWHGASWNFVLWEYITAVLVIERLFYIKDV